jgi:exopolysaccharide transport family protein
MSQHSSSHAQIIPHPFAELAVPAQASGGFHHIDVREIARILRRHIRLIGITVAVIIALALVFVTVVTPLYSATATILIDPRRSSVADSNNNNPNGSFGTDDASIESQVSLMQSLAVMQRVVDGLKLKDDPEFSPPPGILDWVRSLFSRKGASGVDPNEIARARAIDMLQQHRLKILRQKSTFLVDITASSVDRDKAASIANAAAQAYFLEQVRSKYDATKIAAGWMNQQLDELKSRVIASDKAVQDFRAQNNLVVAQGVTINDQQMGDLNTKLIEARTEAAEARAKFEQVDKIAKSGGDSGSVTEALGSDTIARLRTQYADLAKSDADLSTKFGSRHPQLTTVRAQLVETKKLINEEVQRILQARRHTYEVAAAREKSLQKSLDDLTNISTDSGQAQVRLRELQREAEANRTLYESFLARYKEANANESLELADSRIVTRADAPFSPSFPKVALTLGLALLVGLFLGCLFAMLADYLDRRIKTYGQAKASGLPSIAALPDISARELAGLTKQGRADLDRYDPRTTRLLPAGLQPPLLRYAITQPMSQFAEAIRSIRFTLQHVARVRNTQVVAITSAISGEGKSTLAANLAMSLSSVGVKTLLIEGDLRNPQLSRSLCPGVRTGLVEVAVSGMPLHQAILVDPESRLAFLPAPLPKDVALLTEFVSSEGMSDILKELRNHFDVIIVDSPPLLPLIDGRALAELADSIILTVGWDRTPEDLLLRAVDLLAPVHDRIIGTVLTRVDFTRFKYYEPYDSNAYGSTYAPASMLQEAAR